MNIVRPAFALLAFLTLLTGILYPLAITGVASIAFPDSAGGSLVRDGAAIAGSSLLCQTTSDPGRFWPRPSATAPFECNAAASGAANLGPTNPALREAVRERVSALRRADPGNRAAIPVDLVTTSGSGLDPHISPAGAAWQIPRVARARGLPEATVARLVSDRTEGRLLGVFGEPHVNVYLLNRDLDAVPRPRGRVCDDASVPNDRSPPC